jgi:two-component system sensor histidine kinase VicK
MRWWLALAFAGIAAVTAVAVAQVYRSTSEDAIRARAQELAAGSAVAAADRMSRATSIGGLEDAAVQVGEERGLAVFVFDAEGRTLTAESALGIDVTEIPEADRLLEAALADKRLVVSDDRHGLIAVALPLRTGPGDAVIAVASRPDLEETLGIVREEIVSAALWATLIGAVVGLVVASLITLRLRRIGDAAAEIEQGRFDRTLEPRFPDELGTLASTVDRMRARLASSFSRLEGERDRLALLLEQLQEGVVAVDRDLNVEFANTRARRLVGAELTSGSPLPDPWSSLSLAQVAAGLFSPAARSTSLRVNPDESHTYVVVGIPPAPDADTAVLVLTDVTTRERRERAEREFVANAAHELRTPITAIASAIEVLQTGAKDDPEARDRFLEVVDRQTERLTGLVHALLTLARAQTRAEPVRLEEVEIAPILREIADRAGEGGPEVAVDCPAGLQAMAHPDLLRQAIDNVAANAAKHAAGSGVRLRAYRDDSRILVEIADDGPGMTTAQTRRAFDRFYRTPGSEGGGYGLGLAIVRELVEAMDGSLHIASTPGEGTTVQIALGASIAGGDR